MFYLPLFLTTSLLSALQVFHETTQAFHIHMDLPQPLARICRQQQCTTAHLKADLLADKLCVTCILTSRFARKLVTLFKFTVLLKPYFCFNKLSLGTKAKSFLSKSLFTKSLFNEAWFYLLIKLKSVFDTKAITEEIIFIHTGSDTNLIPEWFHWTSPGD